MCPLGTPEEIVLSLGSLRRPPCVKGSQMSLSQPGIGVQILSSLATHRAHRGTYCTENDCIVVLNRLLRAFTEVPGGRRRQAGFRSRRLDNYAGRPTNDHVVPIREIITRLFHLDSVEIHRANIDALVHMLRESLVICSITSDENTKLTSAGLRQYMPFGWGVPGHPYENDAWARYKHVGIHHDIVPV